VDGASSEWFEKQLFCNRYRESDVGVSKTGPPLKIDSASEFQPGKKVGRVAL
jgi:hypothetical protein